MIDWLLRIKVLACGAVFIAMAAVTVAAAHADKAPPGPRVLRHDVERGSSLLTLAGDQLVAWNAYGRVQLRSATGTWQASGEMPLRHIWSVAADGLGYLAAGSSDVGDDVVVLFGPTGGEERRWVVREPVFSLGVTNRGRWAAIRVGFLELLADGRVGSVMPYPGRWRPGSGSIAKLFDRAGSSVICYGADLSMAHHAPATCQPVDGAWRFEGSDTEPPTACGPWLIARDGKRLEQMVVHSISTGELRGRRTYRATPSFACSGSDSIVVGERDLEELDLPSLAPKWTRRIGQPRVAQVAALSSAVAYRAEGSTEVVLVAK